MSELLKRPYAISRFSKGELVQFIKENNIKLPERESSDEDKTKNFTKGELYLLICEQTKKATPSYLRKKKIINNVQ